MGKKRSMMVGCSLAGEGFFFLGDRYLGRCN